MTRFELATSTVRQSVALQRDHPRRNRTGADDEIRTRDIDLGKVALYQLSYIRRTGPMGSAEAMLPQRGGR